MRRPPAKHLAIMTLGICGALLVPSNGKADYFPWSAGCCGSTYGTGYFPSYSAYYPSYSAFYPGYYGLGSYGGYYAGYYPLSYAGYSYGSGCCGCSGFSGCSLGCGSCGTGCCGGPSCSGCGGCGLACAGDCGCGSPSGSGCSGATPRVPAVKKAPANPDEGFTPRPSPTYDEPPARTPKKAPTRTPETGAGVNNGTGTNIDEAPEGEPAPTGPYRRKQTTDPGSTAPPKSQNSDPPDFKTPTPPKATGNPPSGTAQPFDVKKPVVPPSTPKQSDKKAPVKDLPDADSTDKGPTQSTVSNNVDDAQLSTNPALGLQERATWSLAVMPRLHRAAAARIASTASAAPERLKSQSFDVESNGIETKVARN